MNEPLPPPTAAELKRLFAERGVRPSRVRGQNFLVDPAQMRFVADAAELDPRDVVLEPGPGTGGLTALLAARAGAVIAVELDRKLHDIAAERLAECHNVRLIHADIISGSEALAPQAREAVDAACAALPGARLKVVANLPYAVSTAFIVAALSGSPAPVTMVVMVQREVALRLAAHPAEDDYGYLSVIVQAGARVEVLRKVGASCFWPQPKIDSAVVAITPRPGAIAPDELAALKRVAGALFAHRRKQLAASLRLAGLRPSRQAAEQLLNELHIAPAARCEDLDVDTLRVLARRATL